MTESIAFHTDLYRRDALEHVAAKYRGRAQIELAERDGHVEARLDLGAEADPQTLRDEFCTEAFSATVRTLRDSAAGAKQAQLPAPAPDTPPWELLKPFRAGTVLGLGWM